MSPIASIAQMLVKQLGVDQSSISNILPALMKLLPTDGEELDIGALVAKFASSGSLMSLASSWLGDGENKSITGEQVTDVLGQDKISEFASQVGVDSSSVASSLSNIIPQFIDGSSEGGSLMDSSAASLVSGALKSFF